MDADIIGNFPKAEPNCAGCGKPLLIENAWMTDGCPCNTPLGVNNENETRWRLLMQLQQRQSFSRAALLAALEAAPLPSTMGTAAEHFERFYDWWNKVASPAIAKAKG